MSKEMRDVCLCVGTIGICCVLGFMVLATLTGIKVLKTVTFLGALTVVSVVLFYIGMAPPIRKRLNGQLQAVWCRL